MVIPCTKTMALYNIKPNQGTESLFAEVVVVFGCVMQFQPLGFVYEPMIKTL